MKRVNKLIYHLSITGALALCLSAPVRAQQALSANNVGPADLNRHAGTFKIGSQQFYHPYVYPHVGTSIEKLPSGYYQFDWGPSAYYYAEGVFYQSYANGAYKIAAPPIGAEVLSPPIAADIVTIDGKPYYVYKGIYYESATGPGGNLVYRVAGKDGIGTRSDPSLPLIGDLTDRLPEGCCKVMLRGNTYWVAPGEIYLEKVEEGNKSSYRVVAIAEAAK